LPNPYRVRVRHRLVDGIHQFIPSEELSRGLCATGPTFDVAAERAIDQLKMLLAMRGHKINGLKLFLPADNWHYPDLPEAIISFEVT
jgi:hypothetical protein